MKLTDIQPVEKWIELENKIFEMSGLNPTVYNTEGVSITQTTKWVNKLCPEIKGIAKGQTFICSAAHQNIAGMAENTKEPVIDECDAGLLKIVVPIFAGDEFIGAAGGCGLILDDSEVESFLVNKTTEIEEEKIEELSKGIKELTQEEAEKIGNQIKMEIDKIISAFSG